MTQISTFRRLWAASLAALVAVVMMQAALAPAQEAKDKPSSVDPGVKLRENMATLAKNLKNDLAVQPGVSVDGLTVAIADFTGPPAPTAGSQPGLSQILKEELEKIGIGVKARAPLRIFGKFTDVVQQGRTALKIDLDVQDLSGTGISNLNAIIDDRDVVSMMLGLNASDLGPAPEEEKAQGELNDQLNNGPKGAIDFDLIRSSPNSPFAVHVRVKRDGVFVPAPPANLEGGAFVPLKTGDVFQVEVFNQAKEGDPLFGFDAVVEVQIDGLSVFAFSETKGLRFYQIPSGKSNLIKGWHITNKREDEFVVNDLPDAAVATLGKSQSEVGTITVRFCAAWAPDAQPPKDEFSPKERAIGTGRGAPQAVNRQELRRLVGRTRSIVTVRYDKSVNNAARAAASQAASETAATVQVASTP